MGEESSMIIAPNMATLYDSFFLFLSKAFARNNRQTSARLNRLRHRTDTRAFDGFSWRIGKLRSGCFAITSADVVQGVFDETVGVRARDKRELSSRERGKEAKQGTRKRAWPVDLRRSRDVNFNFDKLASTIGDKRSDIYTGNVAKTWMIIPGR